MVRYAQGTRRIDELIAEARQLAYQEQYSYTEGWNDNVLVNIFNLGLKRLYAAITKIDMPPNVEEVSLDVVARQTAYDLPIDVHMALRLVDVRYLYGTQQWEYVTLRQGQIQDRFSYPTNIPDTWALRNGQILLSPTPNITKEDALIINYQKRMRSLDIRRGMVQSYTEEPFEFLLDFDITSAKNANMQPNANSILDLVDWACFVDRDGVPIVNAIPLAGYNSETDVLTAESSYEMPADEQAALDEALDEGAAVYVVTGDYASTHSELDRECEAHLVEFARLNLLRLQSAAEPTTVQMAVEQEVINRLVVAYQRYRPSIYPIAWIERMRSRSWPFGPRGAY